MITSSWKFGKDIQEILDIRASVNDFQTDSDEKSIHLIIYDNNIPVGCGSIYFDKFYQISHLCVKPEFQGQYIGDLMIRLLIIKGFNMLAESIRINADSKNYKFFEKYGFKILSTINNTYLMEVTQASLIMNSKCGHDCSNCLNKEKCLQK